MTVVYHRRNYEELARAVNRGMPWAVAQDVLDKQREIVACSDQEQYFWLEVEQDKVGETPATSKPGATKSKKE